MCSEAPPDKLKASRRDLELQDVVALALTNVGRLFGDRRDHGDGGSTEGADRAIRP
jgi:hypothetical protein